VNEACSTSCSFYSSPLTAAMQPSILRRRAHDTHRHLTSHARVEDPARTLHLRLQLPAQPRAYIAIVLHSARTYLIKNVRVKRGVRSCNASFSRKVSTRQEERQICQDEAEVVQWDSPGFPRFLVHTQPESHCLPWPPLSYVHPSWNYLSTSIARDEALAAVRHRHTEGPGLDRKRKIGQAPADHDARNMYTYLAASTRQDILLLQLLDSGARIFLLDTFSPIHLLKQIHAAASTFAGLIQLPESSYSVRVAASKHSCLIAMADMPILERRRCTVELFLHLSADCLYRCDLC
jgi:hypothetical protein